MVKSGLKKMLTSDTPLEEYPQYDLWVKREDLSCPPPGPPFSKTRGVYARVKKREEHRIGVLDTFHSQAGHAVARACQILGKKCINYYPVYKREGTLKKHKLRPPQVAAKKLGAQLIPLQAGRSCILFHQAKKRTEAMRGYMMPNALKLEESVAETAKEVDPEEVHHFDNILLPASSGTIASGVIMGCLQAGWEGRFIIHLGYSRSHEAVRRYIEEKSGWDDAPLEIIDEGYSYKDVSKKGETPPWPCNQYYDLKAFRWWLLNAADYEGETLLWNIG